MRAAGGLLPLAAQFTGFLKKEARIWAAPARIERRQLPWLGLLGAGTAAMVAGDARFSASLPNTPGQLRWGTRLSRTGGVIGALAIGGGLFAAGGFRHDEKLKETGLTGLHVVAHSLLVTYGLKALTARERPRTGSGRGHFLSGYDQTLKGENSFPSGHSMQAWALASVVASQYHQNRWAPWLAYGFASMVSVSRVAAQRHHVSDVVVGAGVGYLIGRLIQRRTAAPSGATGWMRPKAHPVLGTLGGGLAAQWQLP